MIAVNRMAPRRYARKAAEAWPAARRLWTGLKLVYVPGHGQMVEWLHQDKTTKVGAGWSLGGHANGPTVRLTSQLLYADAGSAYIPAQAPLSVVAFVVRRDSGSVAQQHILCQGQRTTGGWSFKLNYAAGQIGFLRWAVADEPSSTLGAVPKDVPSVLGVSHDGTTARLFQNGRFENRASGQPTNIASFCRVGGGRDLGGPDLEATVDTSYHVIYCWDRTLTDAELLLLWRDPWLPLRPTGDWITQGAGAPPGGGGTARSFFAGMIG